MRKITLVIIGALLFSACKNATTPENPQDKALVKVYDKTFYESDLQGIIPKGIPPEDSVLKAQYYLDLWVKKQLMIQRAELNLSPQQKDVERQLEEYRISLITHKYKQKYLNQKMDTAITDEQMADFYTVHQADFVLPYNVVKAIYIKVAKTSPDVQQIRTWYRSNNDETTTKLRELCIHSAQKYDDFNQQWISFTNITSLLPGNINNPGNFLKTNKYIEKQDDNFYYFVKINDYKLMGETSPFELNIGRIKSTILNKRREEIIRNLERSVYNDAMNGNKIEYFK